jgi:drug/metabolite transporter (DMT)-like permease
LFGLVAVIPFTAGAVRDENWAVLSGFAWFSIAWAAIVSVMLGYSLWGWAIARTGAGRSVPYLFLIPVFTGLFSVIFRGDHLAAPQLIGGAVALAGVAIARVFARPADRVEAIVPAEETGMAPDAESRPRVVPGH